MSFYRELYTTIANTLAALAPPSTPNPQSPTLIRWIDFDLGQLDDPTPPVSFPCALVGFGDLSNINDFANGSQNGVQSITIRVAFKTFERTHSKATPQYRDEALNHLDILSQIHAALNGLSGESFNQLTRTGMSQERRADLRVYQLNYDVAIFDDSATTTHTPQYRKLTTEEKAAMGFCAHVNEL